jgi:hypothetical protein
VIRPKTVPVVIKYAFMRIVSSWLSSLMFTWSCPLPRANLCETSEQLQIGKRAEAGYKGQATVVMQPDID